MDKEDVVYLYDDILLGSEEENDNLPFVATWMALEDIMLSEISQSEKEKCCIISLTCRI